jgi:hypothetical protein
MPSVTLYAEVLVNIAQVSISASLSSACTNDTKAGLSADRRSFRLIHNGESVSLSFPFELASTAGLDTPTTPSTHLWFRLQIETTALSKFQGLADMNDDPWSASSLAANMQVACRSCKSLVIGTSVHVWKDLPSENWAEMMDFWHCHKPDHKSDSESHVGSGYASADKLMARQGTGLVDACHIVVFDADASGLMVCLQVLSIIYLRVLWLYSTCIL